MAEPIGLPNGLPLWPMNLERRFLQHLRRRRLLASGERVVVACSGGGDSTALLHLLHAVRRALPLTLSVVHVDHGLRGEATASDAAFVADLAASLGVACERHCLDPDSLRVKGESLQARAREERRRCFDESRTNQGADWVATAHTRDDVAETVLMNLLKGSARPLGIAERRDHLVRPLLPFTHQELIGYLRGRRLAWREDASNADPRYLRSQVRHRVVPLLVQEVNPGLGRVLGHTAEVLAAEEVYLEGQLAPHLALLEEADGGLSLDVEAARAVPLALRRRLIRTGLHRLGLVKDLSFLHIEAVGHLLDRVAGGGRVHLPGGVVVERRYDRLLLRHGWVLGEVPDFEVPLQGETVQLPWIGKELHLHHGAEPGAGDALALARGALEGTLVVRNLRPGDSFRPAGMGGHSKRLAAFLVDAKVPVGERRRVPLLVRDAEVIAVGTLRAAHGCAAPADGAETVWLSYTPL
jgi:tRNA(Ile)-lysidine synthase